jgi:hypothetical protein
VATAGVWKENYLIDGIQCCHPHCFIPRESCIIHFQHPVILLWTPSIKQCFQFVFSCPDFGPQSITSQSKHCSLTDPITKIVCNLPDCIMYTLPLTDERLLQLFLYLYDNFFLQIALNSLQISIYSYVFV